MSAVDCLVLGLAKNLLRAFRRCLLGGLQNLRSLLLDLTHMVFVGMANIFSFCFCFLGFPDLAVCHFTALIQHCYDFVQQEFLD